MCVSTFTKKLYLPIDTITGGFMRPASCCVVFPVIVSAVNYRTPLSSYCVLFVSTLVPHTPAEVYLITYDPLDAFFALRY